MERITKNRPLVWGMAMVMAAVLAIPAGVWAAGQNRGGSGGNMPALVASLPSGVPQVGQSRRADRRQT